MFSCPVPGKISYVFGSCFRTLAVILVSDLFFFLVTVKQNSLLLSLIHSGSVTHSKLLFTKFVTNSNCPCTPTIHQFTDHPFTKQLIKCTSIFKSNHTMFAMHVHSSYVMTEFWSLLGNCKRSNHGQPSFKLECESRANQTLVSHIVFFVLSTSFQRTWEKRGGWRMRQERKRTIPKMNQT